MSSTSARLLANTRWLIPAIVLIASACSSRSDAPFPEDGPRLQGGGGSCAFIATYAGARYEGRRVVVEPPLGDALGKAVIPACDDGGGSPSADERIPVRELEGIDPGVGIVWEGSLSSILIREDLGSLPPELERYLERPVCDPTLAPIELHGQWIGIIQPDETTEVDLEPPYDLELLVASSSAPEYVGADLVVRVPRSAGRLITQEDIRTSLWKGGSIDVTASCAGDRFLVESTETSPV